MTRRPAGQRAPQAIPGDRADLAGFPRLVEEFCEDMAARGYSPRTIGNRRAMLAFLAAWLAERGITRPAEVTRPVLESYQRHLFHYRKANGDPLSFRSQSQRLLAVRAFFKWAARQRHVLHNPASEIELPRAERRLPRPALTAAEAELVLAQPDLADPLGSGTGRSWRSSTPPASERATLLVRKYLAEVRPKLALGDDDDGSLFLTAGGQPFSLDRLTQLASRYVKASGVPKAGACHLFRHTMATVMLEGGADIRYIQAMLGHARLDTTQIYAQVTIRALQAIHAATHPAAANIPHGQREAGHDDAQARRVAVSGLLAALDDEALEEPEAGQ
ncbi:MAG: tyrosine-type recombinase/integrase [Streptosporangiaceae bacterium]